MILYFLRLLMYSEETIILFGGDTRLEAGEEAETCLSVRVI